MVGWIILGVYIVGYVSNWRYLAWAAANDGSYNRKLEGLDIVFGILIGSMLSLFWPLVVVYRIMMTKSPSGSWMMPRNIRKEKELEAREQEIKKMERELGIK
jgi:hypothetical protein